MLSKVHYILFDQFNMARTVIFICHRPGEKRRFLAAKKLYFWYQLVFVCHVHNKDHFVTERMINLVIKTNFIHCGEYASLKIPQLLYLGWLEKSYCSLPWEDCI